MRIVFVGFASWGHRALEALSRSGHEIVLVITQPPTGDSYYAYLNEDVAALAGKLGVPVVASRRLTGEAASAAVATGADLMVVANWTSRIEREVFAAPRLGTLNMHDSLLPAYAGFSAPNWALVNGETEVGVTAHLMDDGFDTGDIVAQQSIAVGPDDTALDLVERSLDRVEPVLVDALAALVEGRPVLPQDPALATYFHRRRLADTVIDWRRPAHRIRDLVRAQCDPYPNAHSHVGGVRVSLLDVAVTEQRFGGTPGRVVRAGADLVVVAGPEAETGREHGLLVRRVRADDGPVTEDVASVIPPGTHLGAAL